MSDLKVLRTDPPKVPSLYFSEGYGLATIEGVKNASWWTLVGESGRWQLPFVRTQISAGGFEALTPYGYAGIYISSELSQDQIDRMWEASKAALGELEIVSLFLRFAPFDEGSAVRAKGLPGLTVKEISRTIGVRTDVPSEEIWTGMKGRARTAVRKANKVGLVASVRTATEADLLAGGPFRRLYESTMTRLEAASQHLYPQGYYSSLVNSLDHGLRIVNVEDPQGDVVASALILVDDDIAHYHLAGSNPAAARDGANNLMIWTILEWAAVEGLQLVHLGGGLAIGDNLFKFKSSFGGQEFPFNIGTAIVEPERYEQLVELRANALGISTDTLNAAAYFPRFRAKVDSLES